MFTLLRRKVKAGILLYSLLMVAVFALVLQFYLGRVVAVEQKHQAQRASSQAYLMAKIVDKFAKEHSGQMHFDKGKAQYHIQGQYIHITVTLANQQEFQYQFYRNDEND